MIPGSVTHRDMPSDSVIRGPNRSDWAGSLAKVRLASSITTISPSPVTSPQGRLAPRLRPRRHLLRPSRHRRSWDKWGRGKSSHTPRAHGTICPVPFCPAWDDLPRPFQAKIVNDPGLTTTPQPHFLVKPIPWAPKWIPLWSTFPPRHAV